MHKARKKRGKKTFLYVYRNPKDIQIENCWMKIKSIESIAFHYNSKYKKKTLKYHFNSILQILGTYIKFVTKDLQNQHMEHHKTLLRGTKDPIANHTSQKVQIRNLNAESEVVKL